MDLSKTCWPQIHQAVLKHNNALRCVVNGTRGVLEVRDETIDQAWLGRLEVWVFLFNGNELIRVSVEYSNNLSPSTSGISIELAERQ